MTAAQAVQQANARTKPRIGFLGLGWIGRDRMRALHASGVAKVAAVADMAAEAARTAAADAHDCLALSSLDELLAHDLDGVVIATPSALHAEQAVAALAAGVAVFCQKPLARTADEAAAVVDAARKADLPLGLDLSYRHTQAAVEMKKLISSGRIGHVYAADLTFHNAYGPDKPWFHDPALSGGGCLVDLGVHLVDLALWMLGWPEVVSASARLYARGRPADPAAEVEDHALGHVELASGATARIACSWNLHAGTDAVIECAFYGTEGAVIMRNVDGSFYDFEARVNEGRSSTLLTSPPDAWGGRAIVEWAQRLSADRCFSEDAERYVDVARVLDLLYGRTA